MLARLGHSVFLFGLLLAVLIVFGIFCAVAWNVWNDWRVLRSCGPPNSEGLRMCLDFWSWFWDQAIMVGVALIFAVISLLLGAATCYVLGGFTTQPKQRG